MFLPDRPVTPGGLKINPFPATPQEIDGLKVKKPKRTSSSPPIQFEPMKFQPIEFKPMQFKPVTPPKPTTPPKLKTVMPVTSKSQWVTPPSQS
jgi:hypothetical protein